MNAFVMAGDRRSSFCVSGMNKALLPLAGCPIFLHVLMALDRVQAIRKIYIVGPQMEIVDALKKAKPAISLTQKVEVLEQRESLIDNIAYAYAHAMSKDFDSDRPTPNFVERPPALFLPADIPLVTHTEIEMFLSASDMKQYDYCLGVTSEPVLARFYPTKQNRSGIRMSYLYLKEKAYRMNNLHLVRPDKIGSKESVQTIYHHRYQKYLSNRLQIALGILLADQSLSIRLRGILYYLLALGTLFFSETGLNTLSRLCRQRLSVKAVEDWISQLLKTRFKSVETTLGGAAMDIDDEATYQTISLSFQKWQDDLMQGVTHSAREVV